MDDFRNIDYEIVDTLIERPLPFECGGRQFCIYPMTFGKMLLLQRQMAVLGINESNLMKNSNLEVLRVVMEHRNTVCVILAYHTCLTKEEINDPVLINDRAAHLGGNAKDEDLASLMIMLLTRDRIDEFQKHLGISREQKRLEAISKAKRSNDKNSVSIGGKSFYGSFIHPLLEMGLGWDEIMWERSYTNLRMLLADKVNSIYLSDEDLRNVPKWVLGDGRYIDADDPKNMEMIKKMSWR